MKVGLIVESTSDGAEIQVLPYLLRLLDPSLLEKDIRVVPMSNKKNLIENCGITAQNLLAEGYDRVVIIWDLHPSYPDKKMSYCRFRERESVLNTLSSAGIHEKQPVYLLCLEKMLEAWLLADERALSVLLEPRKKLSVPKKPEREPDPKSKLINLFLENLGHKFVDSKHAIWIVQKLPDLQRLKKLETFKRFALKTLGIVL
jgi:hypothetical protein